MPIWRAGAAPARSRRARQIVAGDDTRPAVGRSSPARTIIRVDLPEPDGPRRLTVSPAPIAARRRAGCRPARRRSPGSDEHRRRGPAGSRAEPRRHFVRNRDPAAKASTIWRERRAFQRDASCGGRRAASRRISAARRASPSVLWSASPQWADWSRRSCGCACFLCGTRAGPARRGSPPILVFGDSLTAGFGLPAEQLSGPSRSAAARRGHPRPRRQCRGIGRHHRRRSRAARLGARRKARPRDPRTRRQRRAARHRPETVRANLDAMIGKIQASGAKLLLTACAPRRIGARSTSRVRPGVSRACAGARGGALSVFSRRCGDGPKLNQPDGLHPNERGVAALVDRIAPYRRRADRRPRHERASSPPPSPRAIPRPSPRAARPAAAEQGATLGMLYVSEPAALGAAAIVRELAAAPGSAWVGGVGLGVCARRARGL